MKKTEKIIYTKPSKLIPFIDNIALLEENIKKYDEKLKHLQNKMDFTLSVAEKVKDTPQFQSLETKKMTLKDKRQADKDYILRNINSVIDNFKNTKIEDAKDVEEICKCIEFAMKKVDNETDKGAIFSNILALQVADEIKFNLYGEVINMIDSDKELFTGFLLHDENNSDRKIDFYIPKTNDMLVDMLKYSLQNYSTSGKNNKFVSTILEDKAYLSKLFDRIGKDAKKLSNMKFLAKPYKKQIKKDYHKYRIEHKSSPKLGSSLLKVTAAVPGAVGKLIYGSASAVGHVFGFIKKTFNGIGFVLASPFALTSKGIKKLSMVANRNKTYKEDYVDIYKNIKKSLAKNKVKVKGLKDIQVEVEKFNDEYYLNLNGTMLVKNKEQEEFELIYLISEGEYKSMKNTIRDNFTDKTTGEVEEFYLGEQRDNPEVIRLMRRMAEVTEEREPYGIDFTKNQSRKQLIKQQKHEQKEKRDSVENVAQDIEK